jgi:hypothetical protein
VEARLAKGLSALGIEPDEGLARLGSMVVDVHLNDLCAWTNVPDKFGNSISVKYGNLPIKKNSCLGSVASNRQPDSENAINLRLAFRPKLHLVPHRHHSTRPDDRKKLTA